MPINPTFSALVAAALLVTMPASAQAPALNLVDGRTWQGASIEQRLAYLVGVSNVISVAASYDAKLKVGETFALNAQKGLERAQLESAIAAIDAWYKAHPEELSKPVLSVIWRELAKRPPVG